MNYNPKEHKLCYTLISKELSLIKMKGKINEETLSKNILVKKDSNKIKQFFFLGKIFAVFSILEIPEVFLLGEYKNGKIYLNFETKNKVKNNFRERDLTSIQICERILEKLCYKEKNLYQDESCSELVKYMKANWSGYKENFLYAYKLNYNILKENRKKFIEVLWEKKKSSAINVIIKNISFLNKNDLEHKLNIIKVAFGKKLANEFKIEKSEDDLKELSKKQIIERVEEIAEYITKKKYNRY